MKTRRMSLIAVAAMAMMAVPGGMTAAQADPAMDCHLFPPPVNPVLCYARDSVACQVHWVASVIGGYPPLPDNNCLTPY